MAAWPTKKQMRCKKKTRHGKCLIGGSRAGLSAVRAYGLLAVGVIACLAFIANCFENEDANLERVDREK